MNIIEKDLSKHFPAEVHRSNQKELVQKLFLYNKKIDALLYAYYQDMSVPVQVDQDQNGKKRYQTRVWKSDLPSDEKVGQICRMSRSSVIRKKKILKEEGFLEEHEDYWVILNPQTAFFPIPLDTVKFFIDTATSNVIKAYIYLGQGDKYTREKYCRPYQFTKQEIMKAIKISTTNKSGYQEIDNILNCLTNNGLIKIESFYKGKIPMKRLVEFNRYFIKSNSI